MLPHSEVRLFCSLETDLNIPERIALLPFNFHFTTPMLARIKFTQSDKIYTAGENVRTICNSVEAHWNPIASAATKRNTKIDSLRRVVRVTSAKVERVSVSVSSV